MMIDLTPNLNSAGLLNLIPEDTLSDIRKQACVGFAKIRIENVIVSIRSMPISGYFTGEINTEDLTEDALQIALNHIDYIERSLNNGFSGCEVKVLHKMDLEYQTSLLVKNKT
ncbi:hypothetical protein [Escherichia albertii]|uniref:hypothetical protein n=1 Tax=Escherichia albertii TaxID=208962 RepID=UPI000A19F8E1|nr:hypothetical protein [Escherichia albertii]MCU7270162.1 hypothetical protein [Escherichia albertii]MCZ8596230.1 hypothetical protein [Escherichia albertii]MCZ8665713.1 hypothetical protein [Escherichia albertii]WDC33531.1 hypothetical protein PS048_17880 [Escherichia albertii]HEB0988898.1 hypothetical protein [Escherichia albertii]